MTKKITYRHPWLILAVAVLLLTIANNISAVKLIPTIQAQGEGQDNGNAQGTKIKSVILTHVLLYRGGTLQKELTLTNRDAKYTLAYSCFGRRCDCKKRAEKEVEQGIAEEFLRNVETL
ncbi:MAG: hypothetical protein ABIU09_00585, partial [Pyrinomonadaceae bacterium]